MRILALCGSLRCDSITLMAVRIAAEAIESAGGQCEILCGEAMNLPLHGWRDEDAHHPAVQRLQQSALEAGGFLLCSPEYHGNMSGALKNALDWLGFDHFEGKPSALLAVAGGSQGGHSTLNSLRTTMRFVHGWVIPEQVSIAHSHSAFDAAGRPLDKNIEERLHQLGAALLRAARTLKALRED